MVEKVVTVSCKESTIIGVDDNVTAIVEIGIKGDKGDAGDPGQDAQGIIVVTGSVSPNSDTVVDTLSTLIFRSCFWKVTLIETVTGEVMFFHIDGGHGNGSSTSSGKFAVHGNDSLKAKVSTSVVLNGTELELHIISTSANFLQLKILQIATKEF
jgi:hypothetical protein